MPELPEVRTVTKSLNNRLKGKTITGVKVYLPKMVKDVSPEEFISQVKNKKILFISNKGKFIVFHLEGGLVMLSHLRLEGKYHFEKWPNAKHDHLEFEFDHQIKMYYNDTRQFGTFHLRTESDYETKKPLSLLGPEPQNADLKEIYKKTSRRNTAIKTVLLDQTVLTGLGNIYVDEVLWSAKIHPQTPASKISLRQLKVVLDFASEILEKSTQAGGSSIRSYTSLDNEKGTYQNFLKVHTKEGEPCPRCNTPIIKIKVGGRGTYLCPKEQRIA